MIFSMQKNFEIELFHVATNKRRFGTLAKDTVIDDMTIEVL
jgi:hypothetical protein